jgi:hypothetical protein
MKFKGLVIAGFILVLGLCLSYFKTSYAGVQGTDHDFSITGSSGFSGSTADDNDEVCVYCHTPHGSLGAQTPLWNRTLSTDSGWGFTVYGSSTMDSVPSNPPSTISLLCLSCHDGIGAIDSVLNSPGPGSVPMTWVGSDQIGDLGPLAFWVNIGGGQPGSPAPFDLSDDHPVAITWADRGAGFYANPQDASLRLFSGKIECSVFDLSRPS